MFRALLIKEWTQLRNLRWVGFLLGVLLPILLVSGAEAGKRGWLPFGKVSHYSMDTLFVDLMPAMLVGLWGLLALLFTSQAFAGDRAAGTENFLLERPVPRRRIWSARLAAAGAATLTLAVGHLFYWFLLVKLFATMPMRFEVVLGAGPVMILVGFLGGLGAGGFIRAPIQGVLLGLVLALVPLVLISLLGGLFPNAKLFEVPVGVVLPPFIGVGYVVASWRMACRGEPAGRGRFRRGAVTIVVSFLGVTALFAVAAPISVRLGGNYSWAKYAAASASAPTAVVGGGWPSSAWIVDTDKGRKVRFLPPPIREIVWSPDGSRMALLHSGSAVGYDHDELWLDVLDTRGEPVAPRVAFDEETEFVTAVRWSGDRLVLATYRPREGSSLLILRPGSPQTGRIPLGSIRLGSWQFQGPTADGSLYVYNLVSQEPNRFALQRINLDRLRLDPAVIEEGDVELYAAKALSPSGRFWLRWSGNPASLWVVTDLLSGERHPLGDTLTALWLADDVLVRIDRNEAGKALVVGRPDEEARVVRSWNRRFLQLRGSPDLERVLIEVLQAPEGEKDPSKFIVSGQSLVSGSELAELWVYDPRDDRFIDLSGRVEPPLSYPRERVQWFASDAVALTGYGFVGTTDVDDAEDTVHWVIGRR